MDGYTGNPGYLVWNPAARLPTMRHCDKKSAVAESERLARALTAALSALESEGWVLVPLEPTEAMIYQGHHEIDWNRNGQNTSVPRHGSQKEPIDGELVGTFCEDDIRDSYRAMLASRPAPTALIAEVERLRAEAETIRDLVLSEAAKVANEKRDEYEEECTVEWQASNDQQSIIAGAKADACVAVAAAILTLTGEK